MPIQELPKDISAVPLTTAGSFGGISLAQRDTFTLGSIAGISVLGKVDIAVQCTSCSADTTNVYLLLNNTLLGPQAYLVPIQSTNIYKADAKSGRYICTLPALYDLVFDAESQYKLDNWETDTFPFQVRILTQATLGKKLPQWWRITSQSWQNAQATAYVTYSRVYTPQIYYFSPRAIYSGSEFSVFCDPKATVNIKTSNGIILTIDNYPVDFKTRGTDPNQISLVNGARNEIRAKATDQDVNPNATLAMDFNHGKANFVQNTMEVCSPNGKVKTDCYYVRTLSRIDAISKSQGFANGGQEIIIDGYGFKADLGTSNLVVRLQLTPTTSTDCVVQDFTNERIRCITKSVDNPSTTGIFIGGSGIIRQIYQGYGVQPDYGNYNDKKYLPSVYPTIINVDEQVYTTIENSQNMRDYFLSRYYGLFIPRATGTYRFFLACDDKCKINIAELTSITSSKASGQLGSATSYRNWQVGASTVPVVLTADQPYYIEVLHVEYGGGDHLSVGMEIQFTNDIDVPQDHPQATKEVQRLTISQPQNFDTIGWTISFANMVDPVVNDVGNYTLIFVQPSRTGTILASGLASFTFNVTNDAAAICAQIRYPIYQQALGSDAACTVTRYDSLNATTQVWSKTKTIIVQIRSVRFLAMKAIQVIQPYKVADVLARTQAEITTRPSGSPDSNGVDQFPISKPLTGYFEIQCFQKTGKDDDNKNQNNGNGVGPLKYSKPIPVTASIATIQSAIEAGCPNLKNGELQLWEGGQFSGIIQNGRQIFIKFLSAWDPSQFTINNCRDNTIPIVFGTEINDITFESITTTVYNPHALFYDQIPVENLRTYNKDEPQLTVSVNGLDAVCASQKCNHKYIATPSTCQTITVSGKTVNVNCDSGSTLPSDCTLDIGSSHCALTVLQSGSQYYCILNEGIPTGSYDATITCPDGGIPYVGPPVESIQLQLISINPDHVNRFGGQLLTITGLDFPTDGIDQNTVTVTYGGSSCKPTLLTATTIECDSSAVGSDILTDSVQTVEVCINTICSSALSVTIIAPPNVAVSFSPNPVSPVLRTNIFITFETDFIQPLDTSVWSVKFTSTKDSSYVRKVAIRGNPQPNQWRLRFLGAHAGTFTVSIKHAIFGYVDTSTHQIPLVDANSYIRSISPKSGSAYGGTVITITGGPFSNDPLIGTLENNVKIGNTDCIVLTSTLTEITCKTAPRQPILPVVDTPEQLDVFLKAAEYATCDLTEDHTAPCNFVWSNTNQDSISVFDISPAPDGTPVITLTGNFPSQTDSNSCCSVIINDITQPPFGTCTLTQLQAIIQNVQNGNQVVGPIIVECSNGYPSGLIQLQNGGTTDIVFTGLNVNSGSKAGTQITATIKGLANDATGYKLVLVNSNAELCESYNFIAYETLQCKTKADIVVANQKVKFVLNTVNYDCLNTLTPSACYYQTRSDSSVVTAVALSLDKFSFDLTATNLNQYPDADWLAFCSYGLVYANVVTISGNKVTCAFQHAVPVSNIAQKPVLYFESTKSTIIEYATVNPTLANPLVQTDIELVGDVTCGHGGDCLLAIQNSKEPGLTSALINSLITITVCGKVCVFKQEFSTSTLTVCALPRINNEYTHNDPNIKHQRDKGGSRGDKSDDSDRSGKTLKGQVKGNKQQDAEKAFANDDTPEQKKGNYKKDKKETKYTSEKNRLRILADNNSNNAAKDKNQEEKDKKDKEEQDKKLKDLDVYNSPHDGWSDPAGNCVLGIQFPKGKIGVLTGVKFYISPQGFVQSKYIGVKLQGSNDDGHTWVTIYTLTSADIKQGMNYIKINKERYNQYQFKGTATAGSCQFGKVKLIGTQQTAKTHHDDVRNCDVHDPEPNHTGYETCQVAINWGDGTTTPIDPTPPPNNGGGNGGQVVYDPTLTTTCSSISPNVFSVLGNEQITITGTNFSPDVALYTILIDNVPCIAQTATIDSVTCITGQRANLWDNPSIQLKIGNSGQMTCGVKYTYGLRWSQYETWGDDGQPEEYESVWIPPGLVLIVDVSPPILKEVIVEGGLVFDPYLPCNSANPQTFDAYWLFAKGGDIIIGTEDTPIQCKLIITLHGDRYTPEVPLFGNEVIGVRYGTLDIHGKQMLPPWIDLYETALAGATTIKLNGEVNWNEEDQIVIASTSYNQDEAETRIIKTIDRTIPSRPILTLETALDYKHFSDSETCGGRDVEMRGEVGLLTRNIVIQGDSNSFIDQNGAVISVLSDGDDASNIRIEYVELREMGQAYKLGRYAIHVRAIGQLTKSYIRGNSLHKSYNRFLAFNQVRNLKAEWNVVYDVKGHAFFTEVGNEEENTIHRNLVINTKISWSLQNTDQTPAAYFIQNPKNSITENRAAGSEGYGFWFNLPASPFGVNSNPNICPNGNPLGAFDNNAAHSCDRDGLKQIATYNPRSNPCIPLSANNPSVAALLQGFRSWKNKGDGATFDRVGNVQTKNYTAADNLGAGIEYSVTDLTPDGTAQVNDASLVGFSAGNTDPEQLLNKKGWGVQTPRSENFQVNNVRFCNFPRDGNFDYAAIKTCSNCDVNYLLTDSGARTVTFSQLSFDKVDRYITYTWPYTDILYDLDGTLTGLKDKITGAKQQHSWAIPFWKHNEQPECYQDQPKYNGLICDNTVQVRRIAFNNYQPSYFDWADMKILKYDSYLVDTLKLGSAEINYDQPPSNTIDFKLYDTDATHYSIFPFKQYTLPNNAWAVPFVTGHSYKIHWRTGLDFSRLTFEISPRWINDDKTVTLIFNHTEVRETIHVNISNLSPHERIPRDNLIAMPGSLRQLGDNRHWNETSIRQLHVIANGRNLTRNQVTLFGYNCYLYCPVYIDYSKWTNGEPDCGGVRLWSKDLSWPENGNKAPVDGQDVLIRRNCVYIYDLENSPTYNSVVIEGRVIWDKQPTLVMNTKFIFVKGGWLQIGNSTTEYFEGSLAQIKLHGTFSEQYLAFSTWIEAGGKVLAIAGEVTMYGKKRDRKTRLQAQAYAGLDTITVAKGLDWEKGNQIALAATNTNYKHSEQHEIDSYNIVTGEVKLTKALEHSHFGESETSMNGHYGGVDIRGEVYLLTSNVKITGTTESGEQGWGGHIVVSQFNDGKPRNGTLRADNIEVNNCSQYDTFKAALRFEQVTTYQSSVTNSVFRNGLGKGLQILRSNGILIKDNIFFDFVQWGGNVQSSNQITLDGNVFFQIGYRVTAALKKIPPNGGLLICAYEAGDKCEKLSVINNIVSGAEYAGFGAPGVDCPGPVVSTNNAWFRDNVAHSNNGHGAIFFPDPTSTKTDCFQAQSFVSYKNRGYGVVTYSTSKTIQFSSMTLIDNYWNGGMMSGLAQGANELDKQQLIYSGVNFYGDSPFSRDCDTENDCLANPSTCENKVAVMLSAFTYRSNVAFPRDLTLIDEIYSDAVWNGYALYQDVKFIDYSKETTFCGGKQQLFDYNRNGTDLFAIQRFKGVEFRNVYDQLLGVFRDPNSQWAVVEKCGEFPCTGPKNIILSFEQVTKGSESIFNTNEYTSPFYIISNNLGIGAPMGCTKVAKWNGYYCPDTTKTSQIIFESMDDDKMTRTFSPVKITTTALSSTYQALTDYRNDLNSFSDKGFTLYGGQQRRTRFPFTLRAQEGLIYNLTYTGTVPKKQRFRMDSIETQGVIISIRYTEQNSYSVKATYGIVNQIIDYQPWDSTNNQMKSIPASASCGTNRYLAVLNILEFMIKPDCVIEIAPRDVILASVRLEWTVTDFYSSGGTTLFIDRISAALGVHPSTVKIVGVAAGSVIINYQISNPTDSKAVLPQIKAKIDAVMKIGASFLGAPILDYDASFPVPQDETIIPSDQKPTVVNNTKPVIIAQNLTVSEEQIGPAMTKEQVAKLAIIIGVVLGVCITVSVIVYCICKKRKDTTAIHVQQKGDTTTKQGINISQEFDTQYHPKQELGKVFDFDEIEKKKKAKAQIDNLEEQEEGEQQKNTEDEEQWRQDWGQTDTVRTNANKYTDENYLMNSPTGARPSEPLQFNNSGHSDERPSDAEPVEKSDVKKNESEIYIDTE